MHELKLVRSFPLVSRSDKAYKMAVMTARHHQRYLGVWRRTRAMKVELPTICPFRKSYPDVLVVQSSQDGNGGNGARSLDRSMQRRIFPAGLQTSHSMMR
jgi:hypothetical protein